MTSPIKSIATPLGIRDADPGVVPCHVCGQPATGDIEPWLITAQEHHEPEGIRIREASATMQFGTCDRCHNRAERARAIVDDAPSVHYLGIPVIASRLARALFAMEVVGAKEPPMWGGRLIMAAIHALDFPGQRCQFVSRYSPLLKVGSRDGQLAEPGYAYIPVEALTAARDGAADFLRDVLPAHPIPSPDGRGCAVCGWAEQTGWRADSLWTPITSGAYKSRYLCVPDAAIYNIVGIIGISLMERSVADLVDPEKLSPLSRAFNPPVMRGLKPYADMGWTPAATRHSHLDLSQVRFGLGLLP